MTTQGQAPPSQEKYDVAVVGAGPVGLVTAILLGQRGRRVVVLERWPQPYPLPRAVHFDDESARVLALCGVADDVVAVSEPATEYEWHNGAGQLLLRFDWEHTGPSGWPTATMFSQPDLERVLADRAESLPTITVMRGQEVVDLQDGADEVTVSLRGIDGGTSRVGARYVLGCDGANSFVRHQMPCTTTDLGFSYDWLIVDAVPPPDRDWYPVNLQLCDPARPVTLVSGGPGRRRWEFMRLPDETLEQLGDPDGVWRLLAPWELTAANTTLERHEVYTFQARWADSWRHGRLLIAGDAAHLMPPFAGQGLCSGLRDAANVTWKLDLVVRGLAPESLLDTYATERIEHVRRAVGMSVMAGEVICVTDPAEAAERDEELALLEGDGSQLEASVPPAVLGPGLIVAGGRGQPDPPAGQITVQGRVAGGDQVGLLDQVVGGGFRILCRRSDVPEALPQTAREVLERIGGRVVRFVEPGEPPPPSEHPSCVDVVDLDRTHLRFLDDHGLAAAVVRPDFYVYGGVTDAAQLPEVVHGLGAALGIDIDMGNVRTGSA